MSMIDDLMRLVPPPPEPVDADGDWRRVTASLGRHLPDDYRDLVGRYGFGSFGDIRLWSPFTPHADGNVVVQARGLVDLHQPLRDEYPEVFPYPLFPEPSGLLGWASTGDGDDLCWLTEGEPNNWPVVVWNIRETAHRYDIGAVELLYGYLSGQRPVALLRPAPAVPWFDLFRDRTQLSVGMTEGHLPYARRHQLLREFFAPTADRAVWDGGDGTRQDTFKVLDRDWLITHNHGPGHSVWVDCPPEHADAIAAVLAQAAKAMGCYLIPR